jgi:hypothetical protein
MPPPKTVRSVGEAAAAFRATFERFSSRNFDPADAEVRAAALRLLEIGRHAEGVKTVGVEAPLFLLAGSHDPEVGADPPEHPILLSTMLKAQVRNAKGESKTAAMQLYKQVSTWTQANPGGVTLTGTRLHVTADASGHIEKVELGASSSYGINGGEATLAALARWHRNVLDAAGVKLNVEVRKDRGKDAPAGVADLAARINALRT